MAVDDTGVGVNAVNKMKEDRHDVLTRLGRRHFREGAVVFASCRLSLASRNLSKICQVELVAEKRHRRAPPRVTVAHYGRQYLSRRLQAGVVSHAVHHQHAVCGEQRGGGGQERSSGRRRDVNYLQYLVPLAVTQGPAVDDVHG